MDTAVRNTPMPWCSALTVRRLHAAFFHDPPNPRASGRARSTAQVFEITCHRPTLETGRLVRPPSRSVPRIAPGLDHRHPHPGFCDTPVRVLHQRSTDAAALMIGVDDDHIDLAHVVAGMEAGADPADRSSALGGHIDVLRLAVEDFGEVRRLAL